jgi:uncharacterized protein YkwD
MNAGADHSRPILRLALAATVAVMLTVTLGSGTSGAATDEVGPARTVSQAATARAGMLPAGWRADMLARVNGIRTGAGLVPLQPCPSLRRAAQGYALLMAETNSFSHVGPDGSAPWDRMQAQGFTWQAAAENIASGQTSIAQVMNEWIESPGHYENLMDPRMQRVGFGYAVDSATGTRTYWVQDFGRGTGC